jgi:hypothetical protein
MGCPQNLSRFPNEKKQMTSEFFFKNSSRIPIKIPDSSLEKQLTSPKFYDISSSRTISIFYFYLGFC